MSNPFDDRDGRYLALVNVEGQHSLWPVSIEAPSGWRAAFGPDSRQACLDYIASHWLDICPLSASDMRRTAQARSARR